MPAGLSNRQPAVARVDRVMIGPESRSMPDSTLADPERLTADLQRQLAECRAERDEALAQQTLDRRGITGHQRVTE